MEELKKAIATDKLIIFAGSGLSKQFGLPDWNKMVIDIIEKVNKPDLEPYISILKAGTTLSSIDVLEFLKSEKKEVHDYIITNFKIKKDRDFQIHKKILELSNKVITTNYDNAFELASNSTIIPSKPTSKYTINEINKNGEPFIFKLHGSYDEPDNCIVFKDDYKGLYDEKNNEAAPEKLKLLFSENTFLFLGFSFNDPDINIIFKRLNEVFGNYNKHFIVTPEYDKFKEYDFLKPITIEDFTSFEGKIDELLDTKQKLKNNVVNSLTIEESKDEINNKIAVLFPNTLDIDFGDELKNVIKPFEEIKTELHIGALNTKTLQQIEHYDLLIIISKVFKEKIYIEEDNLKSNLLNLKDICENIPNDKVPILLITNENLEINNVDYSIINISSFKNNIIKRFLFKTLNEKNHVFNDSDIKSNKKIWKNIDFIKGKNIKHSLYNNNRNLEIGKKCLSDVIGRTEEQSNLTTRLLNIINTNKILNIKASGGLGKTTLIKKIAYELYNRGYYKEGVNFKSCENVKKYDDFEDLLIEGFNLTNILNFKEHLIENYSSQKIDLLVILDNFETVVNSLSKEELEKAVDLLKFSSDYANIVITSRERISNEDFEDVFTLTQMITDDALELFQKFYQKKNYTPEELRILREDILEDLLANNPLAIKLVTTSRSAIDILDLKNQIKNHFFESINEEYSNVFKNNADLNIERTRSIYQSINYSYNFLNPKQKLAFELLSLFPDGISLVNFKKCFKKNTASNKISDTELRQLENKSLIDNYNGVLQLQPIIRRFADYQFNKHKENKQKYCIDAYDFNCFIIDVLELTRKKQSLSHSLKLFSDVKNNLLKVIDYITDIKIVKKSTVPGKEYLLNYIYILEIYLTNENNISDFKNKINNLIPFFSDINDADKLIEVMNLSRTYYIKEFDFSYAKLSELFPVEEMKNRKMKNENNLEMRWKDIISHIHNMEGFTLTYIHSLIINKDYNLNLFGKYHYLGLENIDVYKKVNPFYYFENKFRNNKLNIEEIENYIDSLYMEEHLEIMQCTYSLSKIKKISKKTIKKMVVTNPYTKGLKELMFAFNSDENEDKKQHFEKALKNLFHIKYYYLEALYYYCLHLKNIKSEEYKLKIIEGLELSRKFKYQYLDFLFTNIDSTNKLIYNFSYDYYKLKGIEEFVNKNIEAWEKIKIE